MEGERGGGEGGVNRAVMCHKKGFERPKNDIGSVR